ncbi:helicase associated domain-containing protein, partial [Parabacteroides goldsteinii]
AERIARMDAEGFIWTIDDVWMENYEKLQQFFSENNRWPTARENKLGSWCFVQRRALKKVNSLLPVKIFWIRSHSPGI